MIHRHQTRSIELPDQEDYTIAVISDTHGRPHGNLFPVLDQHGPSLTLHAGDVGNLELVKELQACSQTVWVRGNVDSTGPEWPDSVALSIKLGRFAPLSILLLHDAMLRLRLNKEALHLLSRTPARVVVFGHSHIPFIGKNGQACLFNPGSAGPPRMGLPTTMGFIEISSGRLSFRHHDLKTGKEWYPGNHSSGEKQMKSP